MISYKVPVPTALLIAACLMSTQAVAATKTYGSGGAAPKETQAVSDSTQSTSDNPPSSYDLSKWAVGPGNQGDINSCVGWTVGRDLAGWLANYNGKSVKEFAPMYVYSQINSGASQGVDGVAYLKDAFDLVVKQGVDTAADYTQGYSDWKDLPTKDEKTNAAKYKPQLFSGYQTLFADASGAGGSDLSKALKKAIASKQPVALMMKVRSSFKKLDSNSAAYDDIKGDVVFNHAVLAVGYNSDGLVIENHWGTDWGSNGYATLSWKVVEHDIIQAIVAKQG